GLAVAGRDMAPVAVDITRMSMPGIVPAAGGGCNMYGGWGPGHLIVPVPGPAARAASARAVAPPGGGPAAPAVARPPHPPRARSGIERRAAGRHRRRDAGTRDDP